MKELSGANTWIFITFFLSLLKIVFLFLLVEEENITGNKSCEGLYYL